MLIFISATILPDASPRKRRAWPWILCFVFFFLLNAFFNLGRWLVVEDPLSHASAIAVLSGRMPSRSLEAARLYRSGYAPEVWLTHSTEPGATLAKLSVPYTGEDAYDRLILIQQGVPESAIRIIDPPIENTADEVITIGRNLQQKQDRKVIIVTSKVHTRRTRSLWRLLSGKQGQAIVRGVSDDSFDPPHWWRTTTDALDAVREILGLLNVWAGLPLRPAH
jgi:uncharacterized SAM-binding protein YcdF (DUF218 family)